ncbi:transmembrane protein [Cystoisospora suis]|uniref:Transmembrane protein n=1 Tax=Cystoisospora suis TaxID=483139 RepID=A0A2C6KCN6_9APIC|nr:transmembrane protein [Cystoisospora suis]
MAYSSSSDFYKTRGYCLSLAGAVLAYAVLLFVCSAVEISEAVYGLNTLGTLSRGSALVQGRIISLFLAASLDILIGILSVAAVTFRVPDLTAFLAWAALGNGIVNFIFVIIWYLGVRVSLWIVLAVAIPMVRIFASLSNVQSIGGSGFEGRNYRYLSQQKGSLYYGEERDGSSSSSSDPGGRKGGDEEDFASSSYLFSAPLHGVGKTGGRQSEIRSLGTWGIGMSVATGVLLFSFFCLLISMLDCAGYWNNRLYTASTSGVSICLLIQGVLLGIVGLTSLLGVVGVWKSFINLATVISFFSIPVAITILIWWNVLRVGTPKAVETHFLEQPLVEEAPDGTQRHTTADVYVAQRTENWSFSEANSFIRDQWYLLAALPLGIWALMALSSLQKRHLSGFEGSEEYLRHEDQKLINRDAEGNIIPQP